VRSKSFHVHGRLQPLASGIVHGVRVFDRRMHGVERVMDVHPILKEGVLRDTLLHIAARPKSF
jgi:hypothetical protein